jgi:hypothetical protein
MRSCGRNQTLASGFIRSTEPAKLGFAISHSEDQEQKTSFRRAWRMPESVVPGGRKTPQSAHVNVTAEGKMPIPIFLDCFLAKRMF